ncbi:MAG: hypothetical protein JWO98_5320 [Frankiales bacterium]|nr:hypothetical protein [Frankiales bacterium]
MVTPSGREIIQARVWREQEWCFSLRSQHLTIRMIRRRTILPPDLGGLGYDLSEHAIKGLIRGYLERMREVDEESLEEHRSRELADLDMVQRLALESMARYQRAGHYDEKATDRFMKAGEMRRKLLGLDAVVTSHIDVTVTDATDAAIADLAAELDRVDNGS